MGNWQWFSQLVSNTFFESIRQSTSIHCATLRHALWLRIEKFYKRLDRKNMSSCPPSCKHYRQFFVVFHSMFCDINIVTAYQKVTKNPIQFFEGIRKNLCIMSNHHSPNFWWRERNFYRFRNFLKSSSRSKNIIHDQH